MKISPLLPGDLVQIISTPMNMTLCWNPKSAGDLSACALRTFDNSNVLLEGKMGLIVGVEKNLLAQATDYHIQIEKQKYKCRAILADKYLIKL